MTNTMAATEGALHCTPDSVFLWTGEANLPSGWHRRLYPKWVVICVDLYSLKMTSN